MSITPYQPDKRSLPVKVPPSQPKDKLTLSQALTITAGLAGLIGLVSGVVIRFSLAHSTNARFLSPLQTFPALSDWSNEEMREDIDAVEPELPAQDTFNNPERNWLEGTDEADANFDSQLESDRADTTFPDSSLENSQLDEFDSFDTFTGRAQNETSKLNSDPLEALRSGPQLGRQYSEENAQRWYQESDLIEAAPDVGAPRDWQSESEYDDTYSAEPAPEVEPWSANDSYSEPNWSDSLDNGTSLPAESGTAEDWYYEDPAADAYE